MNTVDDLRQVLSEEVRRLQPQGGLETRVLRMALARSVTAHPSHTVARRRRFTAGTRALGATAAVLIVILLVLGVLVGGRIWHDLTTAPAGPPTHAIPRAATGMVTAKAGWRGDPGFPVVRTTDGGAHWVNVNPPSYVPTYDSSFYFLDATHAWVATISRDTLLKLDTFGTTDGGKSWHRGETVSVTAVEGLQGGLSMGIYFLDPLHGWLLFSGGPGHVVGSTLVTSTFMYGTKDGGLHWTLLAVNLWSDARCRWLTAAFSSVSDGWLSINCDPGFTNSALLTTHDGGITWMLDLPVNGTDCPCFADPPVVFDRDHASVLVSGSAPVSQERLFMTSDGGRTWTARTLPGEYQQVVDFIDPRRGWALAGPTTLFSKTSTDLPGVVLPLYRTDDGGLTWVPVPTNLPLTSSAGHVFDVYFVDSENGFADRLDVMKNQGQLLRTGDGGKTWTVVGPEP